MAIAFNICTPPVGHLTFSSFNTPKNWHSTGQYFHNIWAYPWRIWVPPLKNFVKMKASPLENSIFFYFTRKEILNFYNLFPKNSIVAQLGWREVQILNAIAQKTSGNWCFETMIAILGFWNSEIWNNYHSTIKPPCATTSRKGPLPTSDCQSKTPNLSQSKPYSWNL